jgi:hypothetical protein
MMSLSSGQLVIDSQLRNDFRSNLQRIGVLTDEQIDGLLEELTEEKKESYIKDEFTKLLLKFEIEFNKIIKLQGLLTQNDKIRYLHFCRSVIRAHPMFTTADEEMIEVFDKDHSIDSIRILAMRHRIFNCSTEWMEAFCGAGGFRVLIENIDNCLSEPRNETTGKALTELMSCVHRVVGFVKNPINLIVLETRGAIEKFILSLDFRYRSKQLTEKVLEILNLILLPYKQDISDPKATLSRAEVLSIARDELMSAVQRLGDLNRKKPPMDFFTRCLTEGDVNLKLSVLTFINNWMKVCSSNIGMRIQIRLMLEKAGFVSCLRQSMKKMRQDVLTDLGIKSKSSFKISPREAGAQRSARESQGGDSALDGACYLACDGALSSDMLPLAKCQHVWTAVEDGELKVWYLPETTEETPTRSLLATRPEGGHNYSFPLSTISGLSPYVTNVEVQDRFPHSFRLNLYDGCKINLAFDTVELYVEWKDRFADIIYKSKMDRYVWSPPERQLEVSGAEMKYLEQLKFYDLLSNTDKELLHSDLHGSGGSLSLSNEDLFKIIEWQVESHRAGARTVLMSMLRQAAFNSFSAERAINYEVKNIPNTEVVEDDQDLVDAKDEEIVRLASELKEVKARLYGNERRQRANTITSLFLRTGRSKLKYRFLRVANAMIRQMKEGNAKKILDAFKPPLAKVKDRAEKYLELGKYAKFQGMKEHIRAEMFLENFSKEEIDAFFVKDIDMYVTYLLMNSVD